MIANIFTLAFILGAIYNFFLAGKNEIRAKISFSSAMTSFFLLLAFYLIYLYLKSAGIKDIGLLISGAAFVLTSFSSEGISRDGIVYYSTRNILARLSRLSNVDVKSLEDYSDDRIRLTFIADGRLQKQVYAKEDKALIEGLIYKKGADSSGGKDY
ncbi:MAG: hypothetical protein SPI59_05750 [Finegoldia sp.]|nr:hypothetical protein [Finegoldia sp.]